MCHGLPSQRRRVCHTPPRRSAVDTYQIPVGKYRHIYRHIDRHSEWVSLSPTDDGAVTRFRDRRLDFETIAGWYSESVATSGCVVLVFMQSVENVVTNVVTWAMLSHGAK
eukprot:Selendium_serpulae@DN6408_c0_g2_i1.p2